MSSTKVEIEKFRGKNNFEMWKLKMWYLLVQQGLQKSLDGKRNKPLTMIYDEWEELHGRALISIRLCLVDDVLFNIVEEKSATSLWSKLESIYMTNSVTNKTYLKKQLYGMRVKEGMKITYHLNVFNTLICQLTSMDVKIDDEDEAINFLMYLT